MKMTSIPKTLENLKFMLKSQETGFPIIFRLTASVARRNLLLLQESIIAEIVA